MGHVLEQGGLHLSYSTDPNSAPNALSGIMPLVSPPPEERRTILHFGGGGADVSNSVFVSYAVGPGEGLSLIPFPYGPVANRSSAAGRAGYVIRFLRHGDGTNEIEIYRNDTGWIKKLLNDWLPSNPVRTLRRLDIRHSRNGQHVITVMFDSQAMPSARSAAYERTYRFEDASFPPGNTYRGIQFIAKAHSAVKLDLTYQTDSWIVFDDYERKRNTTPSTQHKPAPPGSIQLTPAHCDELTIRAESLFASSDTRAAAELCRQVLSHDPDHADALDLLGRIERLTGNLSDAHRCFTRALRARRRPVSPDEPKIAESLLRLAGLYVTRDAERADSFYQQASDLMEKRLGPTHPHLVPFLVERAKFYEYLRAFSKAGPLYMRTLSILEKSYGTEHPRLVPILNDIGKLCVTTRQFDAADSFLSLSLEIGQKAYGDTHPDVIVGLQQLELMYEIQHRDDKAAPIYRRLIEFQKNGMGDLTNTARRMNNLGMIYQRMNRIREAETMLLASIETWTRAMGPYYVELPDILGNLSLLYQSTQQWDKAESVYLRSLEIRKSEQGPNHPEVARTLSNLATLNHQQKKYDQAALYYQQALSDLEGANNPDEVQAAYIWHQLMTLYSARELYPAAEEAGRRAVAIFEKHAENAGALRPQLIATLHALARVCEKMGRGMEGAYFAHRARGLETK